MNKGGVIVLAIVLLIPLAYSISIKELISRYSFSTFTSQINITDFNDFMVDKNNNGINDTLVFELTTNNRNGNYIFVVDVFDKNGILTNETRATLNAGANKINITFNSIFLSQNQFNYSIKIYNSSYSLKYRKDNILTNSYSNYEEGFKILNIQDSKVDKNLKLNVTLNSPVNGTFETILFLSYNNSTIFIKENKSITVSTNNLIFNFNNETIKRTHYIGSFNILSLKINKKLLKTNFTTAFYDFKDFAQSSYFSGFSDNGIDKDNDNKYELLQINPTIEIFNDDSYTINLALYDLFGNLVEIKNTTLFLNSGKNTIALNINGSRIYNKKLNGPFIAKYIPLFENGVLIDNMYDAYITGNYNFNDFESPALPDLTVDILVSDGYRYGINNVTVNFTFKNMGNKPAFNVFTDIFDNNTFSKTNRLNILNKNSHITYQTDFTNFSDFEISAIADLQDFVEELNESNNAERIVVKLNKKPVLTPIDNRIVNETEKIVVNLSTFDPNDDKLSFSINYSKFKSNSSIFEWQTTNNDSGNYIFKATVSDGFLNDSSTFAVTVLDIAENKNDLDKDGVDDSIDRLIGNEKSVNTSTISLTIFLGNSNNLSKIFNESSRVLFFDNDLVIAEFDFDFSSSILNLSNVTINKQSANATGSLVIKGLKMSQGSTKTLYVDRSNATLNGICIKDDEISAIDEVSDDCSLNDEFKVECDGNLQNSYTCTYNSTTNKYKIEGLKHSGIMQIAYSKSAAGSSSSSDSSSSSGGGSSGGSVGGGSGIVCISNWQCEEWSQCIDGFKKRQCSDINKCASSAKKPSEQEQCNVNETKQQSQKSGNFGKKIIEKIKDASKGIIGITGQGIKQQQNLNNFFDVLAVILVAATISLSIKALFFSKNL